ncbi:MAG: type IX secretion system sortase PorU [Bacteroidales bacterium]|nr:type IX secretion system sortase PorU [Bacteroidales bacterium]
MRILKILFILLIPILSFGNTSDIILKWEKSQKVKNVLGDFEFIMSFEGAYYDFPYENLPVFIERFALKNYTDIVEVSLENKVFVQLTDMENDAISDIDFISHDVSVNIIKTLDRKKPFSKITILPFRINPENGNIEKLLSFKIKIDIKESKENSVLKSTEHTYVSVLASGEWFKIRVNQNGIHKISYNDLLEIGVDISSVDPRNIGIFGNGNAMVSERNSVERIDDLTENSIFISGEEDAIFDPDDYILFYGEEAIKWSYNPFKAIFNHFTNLYSDYTYYYLTTDAGTGKRIEEINTSMLEANEFVDSYNDFVLHELESTSLINSGKDWYGEDFSTTEIQSFDFDISDIDINSEAHIKVGYAIRSNDTSTFSLFCKEDYIGYAHLSPSLGIANFAISGAKSFDFFPASNLEINLQFNPAINNSTFWLDYLEINLIRDLTFNGGQLDFRNIHTMGAEKVTEYSIAGVSSPLEVWDISNTFEIKKIDSGIIQNDTFKFVSETDILHQFIAFDGSLFLDVEFVGKVENQNIHSFNPVDMIIVSHPDFLPIAEELANFHEEFDNLSSVVVTTEQIFNEFSCGTPDPSGIRDFVKMLYDRADSTNLPKYLLLFGDGSFDPKNRSGFFENYVPTFQSSESLKIAKSYVTDDFYGLMDIDEGSDAVGTLDIGIGRLSVSSMEQAFAMFNKILSYCGKREEVYGDWRNMLCFIADDENNNMHIKQAENLTKIIDTAGLDYNIKKIYLDAYEQISIPSGKRYPEVNKAINNAVDEGALVINYTGHGGELGWADEYVIDIPTINSWDNFDKLPIFITATCEFSRFDNPELLSGGECLFLNPFGGAVALFTTTRLSYSQTNFNLNERFYLNFFEKENEEHHRLGDLVRISKTPQHINTRNFVLLGDPALKIAFPDYEISTTSIIIEDTKSENDTLSAKDKITITGYINDNKGNNVSTFNGIIFTKIFDKSIENITLGNDPDSSPKIFETREVVLNKCKASVVNGEFSFSFYLPKDINFEYGIGKISYYAYDTISYHDANGHEDVIIGGLNNSVSDNDGPEIKLYLNDTGFKSGDIVGKESVLLVDLFDEQGINFIGNGIGHDIVAVIDGIYSKSIILNKYFEPTLNNFRSGKISFELKEMSFGYHNLKLKAWDVFNNSSETSIDFYVNEYYTYGLSNIINFPNPFNEETHFRFDHNFKDASLDVKILIFNTHGEIIRSLNQEVSSYRNTIMPIYWNGLNENGNIVKSGIYVYKLLVTDINNHVVNGTGKLVIIR